MLTGRSPVSAIVFLGEVEEGAGNSGVVRYKLMVEISKAKKGVYVLDFSRGQPSSNAVEFDWVHGELARFHDHPEVFDFEDVKLAFLKFKMEVKLSHMLKNSMGLFSIGFGV